MSISKRTRYQVLRRDNFACRYCGRPAPDVRLQVDHVVPRAADGPDDPSNLVTACSDCNVGKSDTAPGQELIADVAQRELAWKARQINEARYQQNLRWLRWDFQMDWGKADEWDRSACSWSTHEPLPGDPFAGAPLFPEHELECQCVSTAPDLPEGWFEDVLPLLRAGVRAPHFRWLWDRYAPDRHGNDRWQWVLKWADAEAQRIVDGRVMA